LVNSDLLLDYYTQDTIWHNPDARDEVVMPDKKPLPSLLSGGQQQPQQQPQQQRQQQQQEASSATGQEVQEQPRAFVPRELSDQVFLELFHQRRLPCWGHEAKLRAIWLLLQSEGRRQGGTGRVFASLQQVEGSMHNVTESYFWIQMVTYCGARMGDTTASFFAEFIRHGYCKVLLDPGLLYSHYSEDLLVKGASDFNLPDKKPLPNLVR
ncbi:unnamed protein product, partial [Polarella glacialis]